jgi:transposase, IS5 family
LLLFGTGAVAMVHRVIGQEQLALVTKPSARSSLDEMAALLDWSPVADLLKPIYAGEKGEAAWPPLAMFKALLLAVWYDLSDVKLAEALDDRASFRRFCGFSSSEPTPERTAFVRFRRALVAAGLDRVLLEAITAQLKAKAVRVKTGTIVDATIIASASTEDEDGRWVKHKNGPAVHGFKAHVAADADTALVEEVAVTPANVNDGKAGSDALPCEVGEVFADSAYRGGAFGDAVRAKGGVPRIAATGMWGGDEAETLGSRRSTRRSSACGPASRRSSAPGTAATACDACDGGVLPRPPPKFASPPLPITSNEPARSPQPRPDRLFGPAIGVPTTIRP